MCFDCLAPILINNLAAYFCHQRQAGITISDQDQSNTKNNMEL